MSAATAIHSVAQRPTASTRNTAFTDSKNAMFCYTIPSVLRDSRIASGSFSRSSAMSATSAASSATSVPAAPIATPTVAAARYYTGRTCSWGCSASARSRRAPGWPASS